MKEALERKPAAEQRKQEVETRKQAVGERIVIYGCQEIFNSFQGFFCGFL